jgi:hypothetical protein
MNEGFCQISNFYHPISWGCLFNHWRWGESDPVFLKRLHRCMTTTSEMCVKSCTNICISCAILVRLSLSIVFLCRPWAQLNNIKVTVQPELKVLIAYYWIHLGQNITVLFKNIAWISTFLTAKRKNSSLANVLHVQMYIVQAALQTLQECLRFPLEDRLLTMLSL